ncbi:oxidoreductase, partial [candidate division KSB3 bacterium]|nr:oxidoreductase [candidate division KSB3 bacterium]MBD3323983.1 oxidoreductase [candidate division KSB3 bacterium]
MWKGALRIGIYLVVVLMPLGFVATFRFDSYYSMTYEVGRNFALIGFMMLCLQFIMAARFPWITRPFGLDIVIRYHKYMALGAALLLVAHPVLFAIGDKGWAWLISLDVAWYIWGGKIALGLLLVAVILSVFHRVFHLTFEKWRLSHDILQPTVLVVAFIHIWVVGDAVQSLTMKIFLGTMFGLALIAFSYQRLLRPVLLKRRAYRVIDVQKNTSDVWTITLAPPQGEHRYAYLPGQFQFLTLHRRQDLPVEEHHWTISSSPTEKEYVCSTIKELGDFTATIGQTQLGDTATVHAPFGRFSYVLHPEERDIVFVIGGIGITPAISMLRHMRDTHSQIPVVLLYGNKRREDILFYDELADMEHQGIPPLTVVHVLENPDQSWNGETGLIDREKIERLCQENLHDKA